MKQKWTHIPNELFIEYLFLLGWQSASESAGGKAHAYMLQHNIYWSSSPCQIYIAFINLQNKPW